MDVAGNNPWANVGSGALIAPSLLACDFVRVGEQVDQVLAAGAELLHVDIMDGQFVPNLSMGPAFVESLRRHTDVPLDVHIMVADAAYYIERFAEAGADSVTFHVEVTDHPGELVGRLRELGLGAGITLRPGTAAETLEGVIDSVDVVLVMTVEPGYGGQSFMDEMIGKIRTVRDMLKGGQRLQVDGGIDATTARLCRSAGADVFVAGSSIFRREDVGAAVRDIREAIQS